MGWSMLRTGVGLRSCGRLRVWLLRWALAIPATFLVAWLGASPALAQTPITLSWNYAGVNGVVGIPQFWRVPPDVFSATFTVFGAQGGPAYPGGAPGGLGGAATATVAVTPGAVLLVLVGGQPDGGLTGPPAAEYYQGGFNGGGDGGAGATAAAAFFGSVYLANSGGAGGGASGVYQAPSYGPDDALVVGGGGGGNGSFGSGGGAGGGGAGASQDAFNPAFCTDANPCMNNNTPGGAGGAPNIGLPLGVGGSGGNAGDGWTVGIPENVGGVNGSCVPGSTSYGDECYEVINYTPFAGGGGGGGYYGGGGGPAWYSSPYGDGGFGGGGGSSFGPPGASFTPGVESGNGFVTVTYTPGAGAPPLRLPGSVYHPIAVAGPGFAKVAFAAPRVGLPITRYRVTAYAVGLGAKGRGDLLHATGSKTPITVKGLRDGTRYTFRVLAINRRGAGPLSRASNSVTPARAPAVPTDVAAVGGGRLAVVRFKRPESPHDAPITWYTAVASPGGEHATARRSPIIVVGLTGGTAYTFKVYATNRIGSSPAGVSRPVTAAGAPSPPSNPIATAGDGAATVTFNAPASTNGAAVARYTVTASPGGKQATGTASPVTVRGLTNGTSYTFVVAAANFYGTSLASPASNAVTPTRATQPTADLAVTDTGPGTVVKDKSSQLTDTITATDNGPDPSPSATLSDSSQGSGASIVSVTPSQGSCGQPDASGAFTCALGPIAVGQSVTVKVAVSVAGASPGETYTNTAAVSGPLPDPDTANNTASASTSIR